jgi:hypothetical protein
VLFLICAILAARSLVLELDRSISKRIVQEDLNVFGAVAH